MEEKQIDRIVDPCDLQAAPSQCAQIVNLMARIVRRELLVHNSADNFFDDRLRSQGNPFGANQIGGFAVDRIAESVRAREAAVQYRLVVAGKQDFGVLSGRTGRHEFELGREFACKTLGALPMIEQVIESCE